MENTKRVQRRDSGSIRVGERDFIGLTWCGEQGAMRLDLLAQLFSHIDNTFVSVDAARKTISRWVEKSWAIRRTILQGEPAYVWLTPAGLRQVGLNYVAGEPSLATLQHNCDVSFIRLQILTQDRTSKWRSEREIRSVVPARKRDQSSPHLPDGEVILADGRIIAIERERVAKTIETTKHIQLGLLSRRYDYDAGVDQITKASQPRYSLVIYYASPEAFTVATKASEGLPADLKLRLKVLPWQR